MKFASTLLIAATLATSAFSRAIERDTCGCTVTVTVGGAVPTATSGVIPIEAPNTGATMITGMLPAASGMTMSVSTVQVPSVSMDATPALPLPTGEQVKDSNMIVTVINSVRDQSGALNDLITPLSVSFAGAAQAPAIAAQVPGKFAALAKTAAEGVSALTSINGAIEGANADTIVTALVDFVEVHQMLLKTVSGKHGIIAKFGFAEPVRVALVNLEAVVDSFAFALINVIPSRMDKGKMAKGMLDSSLSATIKVYSS